LVILAVVLLLVVALVLWLARRLRRLKLTAPSHGADHHAAAAPFISGEHDHEHDHEHQPGGVMLAAGQPVRFVDPLQILAGLVSVIGIGLLTWGVAAYGDSANSSYDAFSEILTVVLTFLAYALLVAGPVVWLGVKRRDWRVGLYVFMWQVIWLLVLLLLYKYGIQPYFTPSGQGIAPYGGGIAD
jgi:hypothetical protein